MLRSIKDYPDSSPLEARSFLNADDIVHSEAMSPLLQKSTHPSTNYIQTVGGRKFHPSAFSDILNRPDNINTPHNTVYMTPWLKIPYESNIHHWLVE